MSEADSELFVDCATTLYACALRVFQLLLLEGTGNFSHRAGSKKDLFITVVCKGATGRIMRGDSGTEEKQVHPKYVPRVLEIIKRRSCNTRLFAPLTPKLRTRFGELLSQCAAMYAWPIDHSYSGTHMFRHGAAVDAYAECRCLRFVMARTGHLSQSAAAEYALSDMERQARVDFQKLTADARRRELAVILADASSAVSECIQARDIAPLRAGAKIRLTGTTPVVLDGSSPATPRRASARVPTTSDSPAPSSPTRPQPRAPPALVSSTQSQTLVEIFTGMAPEQLLDYEIFWRCYASLEFGRRVAARASSPFRVWTTSSNSVSMDAAPRGGPPPLGLSLQQQQHARALTRGSAWP